MATGVTEFGANCTLRNLETIISKAAGEVKYETKWDRMGSVKTTELRELDDKMQNLVGVERKEARKVRAKLKKQIEARRLKTQTVKMKKQRKGVMNFLEVDGEQVEDRDVWKQELTRWGQANLIVHPGKTPQKLKLYIFPNTP